LTPDVIVSQTSLGRHWNGTTGVLFALIRDSVANSLMWPVLVVVILVFVEDMLQSAQSENDEVIQTLLT
jgi:hypothetical protein